MNYGQTVYGDNVTSTSTSTTGGTTTDSATNVAASVITDASVISGVVSGYRNGSNACFYVALPAYYVSSASVVLNIGRKTDSDSDETNAETAESVTLDLGTYYDANYGYLSNADGMVAGVQAALNALEICGGDTNSFELETRIM